MQKGIFVWRRIYNVILVVGEMQSGETEQYDKCSESWTRGDLFLCEEIVCSSIVRIEKVAHFCIPTLCVCNNWRDTQVSNAYRRKNDVEIFGSLQQHRAKAWLMGMEIVKNQLHVRKKCANLFFISLYYAKLKYTLRPIGKGWKRERESRLVLGYCYLIFLLIAVLK